MDVVFFKDLILQGKEKEAEEWIQNFVASNIDPQTQAKALVDLTTLYLEVQNSMDKEYIEILKLAIAEVSKIKQDQNRAEEQLGMAEARQVLS